MMEREAFAPVIAPAVGRVAPAIALAVHYRGQLVFSGGWGTATDDTLFDLASLTKLFTTTAVLILLTREHLPLQTPLVEIVPEFGAISPRSVEGGQNPHTRERLSVDPALHGATVNPADVTLWHLLTHTSGLPPWRDVYGFALPDAPLSREDRWERGMTRVMAYPFVDRVGVNIHYSDIGFILLGKVASRLGSAPLDTVIRRHVLSSLGLDRVTFNPLGRGVPVEQTAPTQYDQAWRARRIHGHVHDENAYGLGGVSGHAGLFGNAQCVAHFGEAWRQGGVPGLPSAMQQRAISEQTQLGQARRGLGWVLNTPGSSAGDHLSTNAYGHTGFTGTSLWVDPSRELVVALLTNRVYYGRHHKGIDEFRRAVHDHIVAIIEGK